MEGVCAVGPVDYETAQAIAGDKHKPPSLCDPDELRYCQDHTRDDDDDGICFDTAHCLEHREKRYLDIAANRSDT